MGCVVEALVGTVCCCICCGCLVVAEDQLSMTWERISGVSSSSFCVAAVGAVVVTVVYVRCVCWLLDCCCVG